MSVFRNLGIELLLCGDKSKFGTNYLNINNLPLTGYENGVILASSFRTYHTPLNKQV